MKKFEVYYKGKKVAQFEKMSDAIDYISDSKQHIIIEKFKKKK